MGRIILIAPGRCAGQGRIQGLIRKSRHRPSCHYGERSEVNQNFALTAHRKFRGGGGRPAVKCVWFIPARSPTGHGKKGLLRGCAVLCVCVCVCVVSGLSVSVRVHVRVCLSRVREVPERE